MKWSDLPAIPSPEQQTSAQATRSIMEMMQAQMGPMPDIKTPDLASWFVPGVAPPSGPPSRPSCDGCSVCCYVLEVPQVGTDEWAPCQYQCAKGCLIHRVKPARCRDYGCIWRLGVVKGEQYRPDRLGALYTARGWVEFGLRYVDVQINPTPEMNMPAIAGLNLALAQRGWSIWLRIGMSRPLGMGPQEDVMRINHMLGLEAVARGETVG